VTEEGNPGNWRGVARVVARLHTPLLDEGVRLVDTPGVGSVHEHNTLATDAYLPSLDAAVLVVSADPPCGCRNLVHGVDLRSRISGGGPRGSSSWRSDSST
jgi:hypothetical protein